MMLRKAEGSIRGRTEKIWKAEIKNDAIKLKDAFAEKYADKYVRAVECPEK